MAEPPTAERLFAILSPVYTQGKNFVRRAFFFVSLMYAGNFLFNAENCLRSKVCFKKQTYARRAKFLRCA